jgi:uncharacterized membrane protein
VNKIPVKYFHYLALTGFFGLFALLMLWNTVLAQAPRFPVSLILLISVTPLLIPMLGVLKANPRSLAWIAFISLFYFIHGAVEAYSSSEKLYSALEILFSLMIFFGVNFYLRFFKS